MVPSEKWAVLVGIDFYINRKQQSTGCVNDTDDVPAYL